MQDIVNTNQIQNPPKQFSLTIAANEIVPFNYAYDFFRILACSDPTNLTVRFGGSGTETDIVGAGIGYKISDVIPVIYLRNKSASPITITFVLAIGQVFDDRLSVSGTINTSSIITALPSNTTLTDFAGTTVTTTAAVLMAANPNRKTAIITNEDTTNAIYVGSTTVDASARRGVKIAAGQTLMLDTSAAIWADAQTATCNVSIAEVSN